MYVCVRACMRARVVHDSFFDRAVFMSINSTFFFHVFYGTFEWWLLSDSFFQLLVRKHTDGQQNKFIFIFLNKFK